MVFVCPEREVIAEVFCDTEPERFVTTSPRLARFPERVFKFPESVLMVDASKLIFPESVLISTVF